MLLKTLQNQAQMPQVAQFFFQSIEKAKKRSVLRLKKETGHEKKLNFVKTDPTFGSNQFFFEKAPKIGFFV